LGVTGPDDRVIRFGVFELNVPAGEFRKNGVRLKLADQPFRILHHLVSHPGEVVTREELRKLLWGEDTFVDFDHGLNASINRLREALGDSAATPRYIETVPRRGYRFIGGLREPLAKAVAPVLRKEKFSVWRWTGIASIVLLTVAGGAWWGRSRTLTATPQLIMRPLTADAGLTTVPVLSNDGRVSIPRQSRGPYGVSRSKRLGGVANAAPC
jgi:DNA-binding winged helix-turn-helix (wHTH) protein